MGHRAILIVIDACRPDGLRQAHTPHLDSLWQHGAYTWSARSVLPSNTLPTHTAMFRGVPPEKHGVQSNTFNPAAQRFPSIMDVAHKAGLHTAMFSSWEELRDLAAPGSLDFNYYRSGERYGDADQYVAAVAAEYLTTEQPDLAFVYLQAPDVVGHLAGWMSPPYIEAIESADRALGVVLAALEAAGLRERYAILTQADHGGHDHGHGTDAPEDLTIPWILNGPGIRRHHALQTPVAIYDTAPTLAHLLSLPLPEVWDGRPVLEAFTAPAGSEQA